METDPSRTLRPLPARPKGNCFGCGQANPTGLHMEFATDGQAVYSQVVVPEHLCGWGTVVHGGIISTLLDEIMGWTAIVCCRQLVLTKSLTVDFLRPLFAGELLQLKGEVTARCSEREVLLEARILNPAGEQGAAGQGLFALFTPEAARSLGFLDEAVIEQFVQDFFS